MDNTTAADFLLTSRILRLGSPGVDEAGHTSWPLVSGEDGDEATGRDSISAQASADRGILGAS
ncbi:MAG: hypothetical protein LJE93_10415 [Acidobacteria bacterium]|nr:hypothetical protein [Acidobacteriota bacterium]